jgi:hypothetical protein
MATIHKPKNRNTWFASYFDRNGIRRHKSLHTGSAETAKKFLQMAKGLEETRKKYRGLRTKRHRDLSDIYRGNGAAMAILAEMI